ncbi:hypothetical protein HOY82DRAFT_484228 [Tuber indicum]|nr:hypothetical protein HOY82DRAFT_484228 [Tuber indicum]
MSKPNGNAPPPPQLQQLQSQQPAGSEEWNEEKLVDSLKRLDDLHNKLISLRTVIPRLTLPLSTKYPSPAEFYADLANRAQSSSQEVLDFNSSWVDNKEIFDGAGASRAKKPEGIQRLSVHDTFMPDDEEEEEEELKVAPKPEDTEMKDASDQPEEEEEDEMKENEIETSDAEIPTVIGDFKGRHPSIGVEVGDGEESGKRTIKLKLPTPTDLLFTIDMNLSTNSSISMDKSDPATSTRRFIVTSIVNSKKPEQQPAPHLYTALLRSITMRPNAGNLQMLLEMIGTYTSLFTTPCSKCNKMTGGTKAELPVVRRKRLVPVEEAALGATSGVASANTTEVANKKKGKMKNEKAWLSFHEVCM